MVSRSSPTLAGFQKAPGAERRLFMARNGFQKAPGAERRLKFFSPTYKGPETLEVPTLTGF